MQFATGGMWTGNQTANKTDAEGRALLPKPNAQWGLPPGSGILSLIYLNYLSEYTNTLTFRPCA